MPFQTLSEAEAAAIEVARTDPTARLCGGVGIVQEPSTGLYRLVVAPLDQLPATDLVHTNVFGRDERLVAYVRYKSGRWRRRLVEGNSVEQKS